MPSKILQAPHPTLLAISKPVTVFDDTLVSLADILQTTRIAANGVGLAAPQIGVLQRVISLNPGKTAGYRFMINPIIIKHGNNQSWGEEGCLSINGGFPKFRVKRWDTITVRFQNLEGEPLEILARKEGARIIQHEIDHLNGKLIAAIN